MGKELGEVAGDGGSEFHSREVVLNPWIEIPFGKSNDPFTEVVYQIFIL